MKPKNNLLKSLTLILLIINIFNSSAQDKSNLNFNYTVDSVKNFNSYSYLITIKIEGGTAPYSCYLFDNEPLKNGKVVEKIENTSEYSIIFKNLSILNYYICLIDNRKEIKGEWIRKK